MENETAGFSHQERVLASLSSFTTGFPFMYFPDVTQKGNSQRHGPDLVWYTNNCALLIFMKASKYYADLQKRERKTKKIIEGNLVQAKGWMRAWKGGQILRGINSYNTISLPYSERIKIVVISIYDTTILNSYIHRDFCHTTSIQVCFSLPEQAFHLFKNLGPVDIIHIFDRMRIAELTAGEPIINCLDIITNYTKVMTLKAFENLAKSTSFEEKLFDYTAIKQYSPYDDQLKTPVPVNVLETFNDLDLTSLYELVNCLADKEKYFSTERNRSASMVLLLSHYVVLMSFGYDKDIQSIIYWSEKGQEHATKIGKDVISITYVGISMGFVSPIFAARDRKYLSALELCVEALSSKLLRK